MSIGDVKRALSGESTNNPNANLYKYGKTSPNTTLQTKQRFLPW